MCGSVLASASDTSIPYSSASGARVNLRAASALYRPMVTVIQLGPRLQIFQFFISEFAHKSASGRGRTDTIKRPCWYRKPVFRPSCAIPTSVPTKWLDWGDTQRYGVGKIILVSQEVRAVSGTERDGLKPP